MPIPNQADQQVLMLYADVRSAEAVGSDVTLRNVDTRLQNIRAFTDLPEGADSQIEAVRHQAAALAQSVQEFGRNGDPGGAMEEVRERVVTAIGALAKTLEQATSNAHARTLRI